MNGLSYIAGAWRKPGTGQAFQVRNPRTGEDLTVCHECGPAEADASLTAAAEAFVTLAQMPYAQIARYLNALAEAVEALGDDLIRIADSETALGVARLTGERNRTCAQLRAFRDLVLRGSWLAASIDLADPARQPIPRPDIRRMLRPLGPVAVFGASNFPLAFGMLGGDTASALAAGNPVVVKGHPNHPHTNELLMAAAATAEETAEMPAGTLSLLQGSTPELAEALVTHERCEAVGFTGSLRVGRRLFDLAAQRPRPIPVFAEMGSSNPVFVGRTAVAQQGTQLAKQIAASALLSAGQFCTAPGIVILPPGSDAFIQELASVFGTTSTGPMLSEAMCTGPVVNGKLVSEQQLEEMIVVAPEILSSEWMLIGQQEQTGMGGRIDLLAIAPDASLVLIELKRNRTPREIVAQAIDYASWVEKLTADKISQIYARFSGGKSLDEAFKDRFGEALDEDNLNQSHQIVLVAAELDDASERIINYLSERDIPINVLFFQVFQLNGQQLLSRAWLIDPGETQENVATSAKPARGPKEPWNGEFYVSYSNDRSWDDAVRYGFVSGGGNAWYSQTLKLLSPGDRIWVNIPKVGYVGVGVVTEARQPVSEFTVPTDQGPRPALDVLSRTDYMRKHADNPERAEYFVRVNWLDTVPKDQAFSEVGLFGNQNTVCKPTVPKWRHTIDRLKAAFPNWSRKTGTLAKE
jgi:acyl-CoA reductase-like NAD-dependent aldehyde dehydrogenase